MTLDAALARLRAVADVSQRLHVTLPNGVPDAAAAELRLAEGIAALAGEALLDPEAMLAHVRVLAPHVGRDAVATVERLLGQMGPAALCEAALAGSWEPVEDPAAIVLLDYAARPALRAGRASLSDVIARVPWSRGVCPACGALPALAELHGDKEGRTRVLRCARCTAAWAFARLGCPGCGERQHAKLRYIHIDGEQDRRRAECCRHCGFFVKAVARLDALASDELLAVDIDTLPLDALALEAGYSRQPGRTPGHGEHRESPRPMNSA